MSHRKLVDRAVPAPLSAYRLMWLMTLFDLPVMTPLQRAEAAGFRNHLLDLGFIRCQYSVYLRFCEDREQVTRWIRAVRSALPTSGKVICLAFTDKQYAGIVQFNGVRREKVKPKPEQYELF